MARILGNSINSDSQLNPVMAHVQELRGELAKYNTSEQGELRKSANTTVEPGAGLSGRDWVVWKSIVLKDERPCSCCLGPCTANSKTLQKDETFGWSRHVLEAAIRRSSSTAEELSRCDSPRHQAVQRERELLALGELLIARLRMKVLR
jgi:hypothetical protein